jgi:hypothetical protein
MVAATGRPTRGPGTGVVCPQGRSVMWWIRRRASAFAWLPCLVVLASLASCGSPADSDASEAARTFHESVARADGLRACAALSARTRSELEQSGGKPCPAAVLEESLPPLGEPVQTRVYGTAAQVGSTGDTVFLSRFDQGWKVTAAGCTRQPTGLYDCQIQGG